MVGLLCFFFFCQAEDGKRDLVRSRGLGEVYKRQRVIAYTRRTAFEIRRIVFEIDVVQSHQTDAPVSYTHLTLPTIYSV